MFDVFSVRTAIKERILSTGLYQLETFSRWSNRSYATKLNQETSF